MLFYYGYIYRLISVAVSHKPVRFFTINFIGVGIMNKQLNPKLTYSHADIKLIQHEIAWIKHDMKVYPTSIAQAFLDRLTRLLNEQGVPT